MSAMIYDFLPFPKLSLPKRVIIENRMLNVIYYLCHIPIVAYSVVFFIMNMAYTEEVPNNPFTLIELDPVNAKPFMTYQLNNDPSQQIINFCADGDAGTFAVDCSLSADAAICEEMFGSLLMMPFTLTVDFFCSMMCGPSQNNGNPKCFLPPTALIAKGSQEVDLLVGTTIDSGPVGAPGSPSSVKPVQHKTNPMIRDAVLNFKYSFQLAQPAPFLLGLEDPGLRKTNSQAVTVIVDNQDIVRRIFSPGEIINMTVAEIVEVAGAVWNYTMVFRGSEFIVTTNCFTAQRDLPPALYWGQIDPVSPREELPLCMIAFTWLQASSVSYSTTGGFARDVTIRVTALRGDSFSRLPSVQFSLLNLVSLAVLLSIPPAFTGLLARSGLGPLSKIYRQATQENFDMPMQLATAGLNSIANVATFGSLASSTLSKEELKVCLRDAMATSTKNLEERDLDRLTNFIFEKDPRYPRGARKKPQDTMESYGKDDKIGEPRVDAARFALSSSFRDPVMMEDIRVLFDTHRDRAIMERLFTPTAIMQAVKDQRGLEMPAWKKELLGVTDEVQEEEILGEEGLSLDMQIKVRSETTEVPRDLDSQEEASATSPEPEEAVHSMAISVSPQGSQALKPCRSLRDWEDQKELVEDLRERMRFQEESQARRLQTLETHNDSLRAENEELKREMADLRRKQAELKSRCDRQLASMQELTRALRTFNAHAGQDLIAENQMPSSCFTAATSFQRP